MIRWERSIPVELAVLIARQLDAERTRLESAGVSPDDITEAQLVATVSCMAAVLRNFVAPDARADEVRRINSILHTAIMAPDAATTQQGGS